MTLGVEGQGYTPAAKPIEPGENREQHRKAMADIDQIVVIHDFSEPRGGAGLLAVESVRQYRALGLPVTMISGQGDTETLSELGATVIGLNSKPLLELPTLRAFAAGYHNKRTVELLSDWIEKNDTPGTVYHMHNWAQILSPTIFIPLRKVAERTLITCHDFFNACPNGAFLHFGRSEACHLKPMSTACMMSQCDRRSSLHKVWRLARHNHLTSLADFENTPYTFSFIHEKMLDRFAESGFKLGDALSIRNPVRPWCSERVKAEENTDFLFVGRIGREKGADLLLNATAEVGAPLTLVGTGELMESGKQSHPHANFVGWQAPSDIQKFATKARALVVPSRWTEPFGLVILEAAMSGIPVIVSDQAYLASDIDAHAVGKSFELADPTSLSRTIGQFMEDHEMVKQMSVKAFETAGQLCHTPESWAQAHIDQFVRKIETAKHAPHG